MNRAEPPRIASWMLKHLLPDWWNETLAGDLLESFHSGRSRHWYWRQVFSAIGNGVLCSVRRHYHAIAFAGFWCMLAPAWFVICTRFAVRIVKDWDIWQLMWPWSIFCSAVLSVGPGLFFVWTGLLLYLVPGFDFARNSSILRLGKRVVLSAFAFTAIAIGIAWLTALYPEGIRFPSGYGPVLSVRPEAPLFARRMLGGGRDVTVVRREHSVPEVQIETRIYVVSHSLWESAPYRIDNSASSLPAATPLAAVEEFGLWSVFNRLIFFICVLIAIWWQSPKKQEGRQ